MRRCVYTALTGFYETLNEQPAARGSDIPFICFTDDPALVSETWQVRPMTLLFGQDFIRSQRAYKLRAHAVLPEFEQSLYIDNSVLLKVTPEEIFAGVDFGSGLALPAHSFRETVADEFVEVTRDRLDDPARIAEQLAHYRESCPQVLEERPFWAGMMLRDHGNEAVRGAMEIWFAHVLRYSRRDQLSCRAALAAAEVRPDVIEIDNWESWFHSWPHAGSRLQGRRVWPAAENEGLAGRLQGLENEIASLRAELAEVEHERTMLLTSTAWRMTAPLRRLAQGGRRLFRPP